MQLNIGTKIKELRRRDGRTQEALAEALGVTNQAVSRWESGGSYPDMELLPAIANYFHVSIDELFGYQNDREEKIKAILAEQFDVEEDSITMETNIQEDLGADSLDVVDLIMSLEDEFEFEVPDHEVENIKTVGALVQFVEDNQ